MNERIRELAVQAGLKFASETELSPQEQKFAELIVRECAKVELYWLSNQDQMAVATRIKDKFGV